MGQYKHHVFVCTEGKSCRREGAEDVHRALKRGVKDAGSKRTIRINEAGCMNQCGHGPMVVVYPANVWYAGVTEAGAERIVTEHLVGGRAVERFRYIAPAGDNKE